MATPVYPATQLAIDQLDPPFGGAPANRFGQPARSFIDGVLQFLENAFLKYLRVEYMTMAAILQTSCVPGDWVAIDTSQTNTGGYYLRKVATGGLTSTIMIGCCVESGAALARVRVAYVGILAPQITGVASGGLGAGLTVDGTTGRLRLATNNEVIYAVILDTQFNVLVLPAARLP